MPVFSPGFLETKIGGVQLPHRATLMLSKEKCETEGVRVTIDLPEAGPNQMKAGVILGYGIVPLKIKAEKGSIRIENVGRIFCSITGFVNFWLQYLLLVE